MHPTAHVNSDSGRIDWFRPSGFIDPPAAPLPPIKPPSPITL